jgi:hypothetical protein
LGVNVGIEVVGPDEALKRTDRKHRKIREDLCGAEYRTFHSHFGRSFNALRKQYGDIAVAGDKEKSKKMPTAGRKLRWFIYVG